MMTQSRDWFSEKIANQGYIAEPDLISSLYLMSALQKPLLIEGEAGVGKTEVARCLAAAHQCELIRLQCYEGLDAHHALYDWDYQRQLLAIQLSDQSSKINLKGTIYSEEFLLKRPLLAAIASERPVVLLIDEIDRADEEFEALLLEILSDFQISIPELGTFTATSVPHVVLTSNGVRELSDALRRRCLYHYIDYPDAAKELAIVSARIPGIEAQLLDQVILFVQNIRQLSLRKKPGVAETLDWCKALVTLNVTGFDDSLDLIDTTLSCLLKTRGDIDLVRNKHENLSDFLDKSNVA